jgi:hypothetical protein
MSANNPTNPGPEYLIIYPAEGGAWGGHYATVEIALAVASGRLGMVDTTLDLVVATTPREWNVRSPGDDVAAAPRIVEVL